MASSSALGAPSSREPSSVWCRLVWDASDDAVTSRLAYVETAAALAQALRNGRMTASQHVASSELLEAVWAQCEVLELDQPLAVAAGSMAHAYGLRGYDAVHCASADRLHDDDLVAVSGDRKLLTAWGSLGLAVFDVNGPEPPVAVR
jgi:uncharacterized protein